MINNYTKRKEEIQIKNLSTPNADCNNYINTGIYYLGSKLTNAPQEYIKLIVLGKDKSVNIGDVFQIAGGVSNGKMYCRNGNFKASEGKIVWGQWRCLTQNITTGTEYETGRIIDGKKEYGLLKNLGAFANSGRKDFNTGLSSSYKIKKYQLFAKNKSSGQVLTVPFMNLSNTQYLAGYFNNPTLVVTMNNYDFSGYDLIIEVYYTKS